jgi:hypothetical protein
MQFCQSLLQQHAVDPDFPSLMMLMDEAAITRDGIINFHNSHEWADENFHATFQSRHQQRFSIKWWAGTLGDRMIAPYVLPQMFAVREHPHNSCPERWVGRVGIFAWPPRSLRSAGFFLWGHLKSTVYATAVNDVADLSSELQMDARSFRIPYLRVYKPHFDKNSPSKIEVRLIHGIKTLHPPRKSRYHTDDRAHDAGILCCETPSGDR